MDDIIHTALHEAGHFFGLRHTTATSDDIQYVRDGVDYGDYSNVEDGLDDTPYCPGLLKSGLYKTQNSIESDIYKGSLMGVWNLQGRHTSTGVASCPDVKNEMFPVAVVGVGYDGFTEQQLAIIRKTLMIYPH